ncbi:unnamed protein product [Rhodiola kirilowii]
MATLTNLTPKTLTALHPHRISSVLTPSASPTNLHIASSFPFSTQFSLKSVAKSSFRFRNRAAVDSDYSSRRSSSNEPRETIMLPGFYYNHWLIVMEFPKDPAPTREQMIDTYLNTLATVLGSTTTYTGFQCTVSEETSEKFKGLPGVLWVLPDSYIDVKNKDYGGDKYINGEIIPGNYPVYQPNKRRDSKYESRRYERKRDGSSPEKRRLRQEASRPESASG